MQTNTYETSGASSPGGGARTQPPLGSRGVRYISDVPAGPQGTAMIASVSDQEWIIPRTYGTFRIPACRAGETCGVLEVLPRTDAIDLGDNRKMPFVIAAREIALDLVQDLERHGVFVCEGNGPTREELERARAKREQWFRELVEEADVMWARGHTYREISDMHRRAAIALGAERDWSYVPGQHVNCPACDSRIKAGVAVCRYCGAVLDAERAARHGLGPGSGKIAAGRPEQTGAYSGRSRGGK